MKKRRIKINYNVRKSRKKVHPVRNDNCENDYIFIFEILSIHFFSFRVLIGNSKATKTVYFRIVHEFERTVHMFILS